MGPSLARLAPVLSIASSLAHPRGQCACTSGGHGPARSDGERSVVGDEYRYRHRSGGHTMCPGAQLMRSGNGMYLASRCTSRAYGRTQQFRHGVDRVRQPYVPHRPGSPAPRGVGLGAVAARSGGCRARRSWTSLDCMPGRLSRRHGVTGAHSLCCDRARLACTPCAKASGGSASGEAGAGGGERGLHVPRRRSAGRAWCSRYDSGIRYLGHGHWCIGIRWRYLSMSGWFRQWPH